MKSFSQQITNVILKSFKNHFHLLKSHKGSSSVLKRAHGSPPEPCQKAESHPVGLDSLRFCIPTSSWRTLVLLAKAQ